MARGLTPEYLDQLNGAIQSAHSLFNVLSYDVQCHIGRTACDDIALAHASEHDASSPFQQSRRDYVRACFACIEALCFSMKSLAQRSLNEPSLQDQLLCLEQDFDIGNSGEVSPRKRKIGFFPNLRYSFDVFCRSFGITNTCDYTNNGFRELKRSVAIRDRLMHPKQTQDLLVTAAELLSMADGFMWFTTQHQTVVSAGLDTAVAQLKQGAVE